MTSTRRYMMVADSLRNMLAAGRWRAGERLPPERLLSEELDLPRATLREALIVLEMEGLVEVRHASGVYVRAAPPALPQAPAAILGAGLEEIGPFELLKARQVVESAVAAAAALAVSEAQLSAMERALRREEDDISEGRGSYEGDAAFHRLVAESSQNPALAASVEMLWTIRRASPLWSQIHVRIFDEAYRRQWSRDHQEILTGLRRRCPETARSAMWRHLGNVHDTLLELSAVGGPEALDLKELTP